MTKITFTPYLKKKYSKDNHGTINIRITENRKSKYISLKEPLQERFWNENKKEIRIGSKDYERLTNSIKDKIKELDKLHSKTKGLDNIFSQHKKSFIAYLLNELTILESRSKFGTYKRYKTTYYHLKNFLTQNQKTDLLFPDIDYDFVNNFESYLLKKKIKENTTKNYINCIRKLFHQSIKKKLFIPNTDPFILYVNRRSEVEKRFLSKKEVDSMMAKDFEREDILFHIKNYFLFQFFAQGLRVRDLLTLRFGNLIEGEIVFIQSKTRRSHNVYLNDNLVMILKDYIGTDNTWHDLFTSLSTQRYNIELEDVKMKNASFEEVKKKFNEYKKERLSLIISGEGESQKKAMQEVENFYNDVEKIMRLRTDFLLIVIHNYAKTVPNKFLFPILKEKDFEDVVFNSSTVLTKYQNNQIESKVALYNKRLKKLQKECEISTRLTSHLSRHTYSSLMLEDNADVYDISKSLGHQRLSTTEHYLAPFQKKRIFEKNISFNKLFSHS